MPGMLHTPSFNLGLSAGIAWKHSGRANLVADHGVEVTPENNPEGYAFMMDILERSIDLQMFFPSSFMEGFCRAFDSPNHFIETIKS